MDVTKIFDEVVPATTFPVVRADMKALGQHFPLPDPASCEQSEIGLGYDVLRRLPRGKFRPHDEIAVGFDVAADGKLKVTRATWVNTAAWP